MENSDQEVYIYKPCSSLTYYPKPKLWLGSLNTQAYISLSCQFLTNVSLFCLESNKSFLLWPLFSPQVDFFFSVSAHSLGFKDLITESSLLSPS